MSRFLAKLMIKFVGIHGVCHRNKIYQVCKELDLQ